MVVISVKHADNDGFLFETTTSTTNDALITSLCSINNDRLRVNLLAASLQELGKFGPMKKAEDQGLDEVQEKYQDSKLIKNEFYTADPSGIRTGNGPGPQLAETLNRVAMDAAEYCDKAQVQKRVGECDRSLAPKLLAKLLYMSISISHPLLN